MIGTIFGVLQDKIKSSKLTGNIPLNANPVNLGNTTTILDIDSCAYSPKAPSQLEAEIRGNQDSNGIQDIYIRGNFDRAEFINLDNNNSANTGVCMLNPTINPTVSNNMLYQGYDVMDGDLQ